MPITPSWPPKRVDRVFSIDLCADPASHRLEIEQLWWNSDDHFRADALMDRQMFAETLRVEVANLGDQGSLSATIRSTRVVWRFTRAEVTHAPMSLPTRVAKTLARELQKVGSSDRATSNHLASVIMQHAYAITDTQAVTTTAVRQPLSLLWRSTAIDVLTASGRPYFTLPVNLFVESTPSHNYADDEFGERINFGAQSSVSILVARKLDIRVLEKFARSIQDSPLPLIKLLHRAWSTPENYAIVETALDLIDDARPMQLEDQSSRLLALLPILEVR